MDATPSNITTPENAKALSIQLLNAASGISGSTGNNFALELQPYWYFHIKGTDFFKYNNLKVKKQKSDEENQVKSIDIKDYNGQNIFGDVWKKLSISAAHLNGKFDVFETERQYASVGVKTRLISIRNKNFISDLQKTYFSYQKFARGITVQEIEKDSTLTPLQKAKKIGEAKEKVKGDVNKITTLKQLKPTFSLDIASAYSHFLGSADEGIKDQFGRLGFWATTSLALKLDDTVFKTQGNNYLNIYGIYRFLRNGINVNEEGNFFIENAHDFGTKVELEINRLSIAYEFISRSQTSNDSNRSIGNITYKVNESISLNGGFGENFDSNNRSVALLGIQWGLDFNEKMESK